MGRYRGDGSATRRGRVAGFGVSARIRSSVAASIVPKVACSVCVVCSSSTSECRSIACIDAATWRLSKVRMTFLWRGS